MSSSSYDKDADVLYVTLGSGEPSYVEEVDDFLCIERGALTGIVTGYRILNVSKWTNIFRV